MGYRGKSHLVGGGAKYKIEESNRRNTCYSYGIHINSSVNFQCS